MRLLNIGFGNMVSSHRLITILNFDSSPIKRLVQESKRRGFLIDATYGRKTRSVLVMDSGHVIASAISADVISMRIEKEDNCIEEAF